MSKHRTKTGLGTAMRGPVQPKNTTANDKAFFRDAIRQNINLTGLHFEDLDLRDVTLDGIILHNTVFENCDLTGANISEAELSGCTFKRTRLFDTCFCYTQFTNCSFLDSPLGATDFSQASMHSCVFSGPSSLNIDFQSMDKFHLSVYCHDDAMLPMHQIPIVIQGLPIKFVFLDDHVMVGGEFFEIDNESIKIFNAQFKQKIIRRCTTYN